MPDFEEGRTEMVEDNQWPDMLIALTEVFANTPAALLLLQRFAWQRLPRRRAKLRQQRSRISAAVR